MRLTHAAPIVALVVCASLTSNAATSDVRLIDFPDPHSFALGKLYTTRFYRLLRRHLADGGAVGIQATSPLTTRRSFWCVMRTMEAAGLSVKAYHAAVPSFGGRVAGSPW